MLRNAQLHKTITVIMNLKRIQLVEDISTLFDNIDKMFFDDQLIFFSPLETKEKSTLLCNSKNSTR